MLYIHPTALLANHTAPSFDIDRDLDLELLTFHLTPNLATTHALDVFFLLLLSSSRWERNPMTPGGEVNTPPLHSTTGQAWVLPPLS